MGEEEEEEGRGGVVEGWSFDSEEMRRVETQMMLRTTTVGASHTTSSSSFPVHSLFPPFPTQRQQRIWKESHSRTFSNSRARHDHHPCTIIIHSFPTFTSHHPHTPGHIMRIYITFISLVLKHTHLIICGQLSASHVNGGGGKIIHNPTHAWHTHTQVNVLVSMVYTPHSGQACAHTPHN